MKTYEVELRALLTKQQYKDLEKYFDSVAKGTSNDMETYTFLTNDFNLKIKNQIQKKSAKIVMKNGAEYKQQANEFELSIKPEEVENALYIMKALGYEKHIPSFQRRVDYEVGEFSISLKDETYWRYHVEVELQVEEEKNIPAAKEKILAFLKKFNLTPMTEEIARQMTNKALEKCGMKPL
jgi:adenylate cyclase class IV